MEALEDQIKKLNELSTSVNRSTDSQSAINTPDISAHIRLLAAVFAGRDRNAEYDEKLAVSLICFRSVKYLSGILATERAFDWIRYILFSHGDHKKRLTGTLKNSASIFT